MSVEDEIIVILQNTAGNTLQYLLLEETRLICQRER
jgi:hypothetical protein